MRWILLLLTSIAGTTLAADWISLFDGKSLEGWKSTEFAGHADVEVVDGALVLGQGLLTGVNYTGSLPTTPYELEVEARRTLGSDFFMVTLRVTSGETESRGKALLMRDDTGWPAIVWRKYS